MSYRKPPTLSTSVAGADSMDAMALAMLPEVGRGLLPSAPALPVQIGEIVADKYRVERVIGRGSMGVVVQASHVQLRHRVAIKFMLPQAGGGPGDLRRFEQEARATSQLKSEHVARVTDFGTLPNGTPYIIAEYLEGTDLDGLLSQNGPLPVAQTATYIAQACEAIAEAHGLGIVHRDLKPQNLFLTHRMSGAPCIKVLDFGVAKSLLTTTGNGVATAEGSMVGSPAYMAPEQIEARPVDGRTDVWALGVCLYQLVSGAFPFAAPTVGSLAAKILSAPPLPLRERAPAVPIDFETVVHRCLARRPGERFASVAELARALQPFVLADAGSPTPDELPTQRNGPPKDPTSSASPSDVKPGDVLAGKYRVERVLGAGGMGVVVSAHHIQLDKQVALKFLLPRAVGNAAAIERFAREARAAARITSEHVARVYDVGQLDDGAPYMVMEFLEGGDLSDLLRDRGPLPVEQAVDFALQACEAIAEAHSLGIIHRDLKPANLFWTRRADGGPSIKVLDFGISKVTTLDAQARDMTRTNALLGSPLYMSPEQMQSSRDVDSRTDIWSLGVILFELLSGRPPFDAETVTELAIKVATQPTPSLLATSPHVPTGLDAAIARCLAKDQSQRFQSIAELAQALREYGSSASRVSVERVEGTPRVSVRVAGGGSQPPGASSPPSPLMTSLASAVTHPSGGLSVDGAPAPGPSTRRRSTRVLVVGALGGVAVVAAMAAAAVRSRAPTAGAPGLTAASVAAATVPAPSASIVRGALGDNAVSPGASDRYPGAGQAAEPGTPAGPSSQSPSFAQASASLAAVSPPPAPRTSAVNPAPRPLGHPPEDRAAMPPSRPTTATPDGCNPPYVIDASGHRKYRPECL